MKDSDFVETPGWATRAILEHLPLRFGVFEPCAGHGAIVHELLAADVNANTICGMELDVSRAEAASHLCDVIHGDSLLDPWPYVGLAITNPPFSKVFEYASRARELSFLDDRTVALLMPLAVLGQQRWRSRVCGSPDIFALDRRPFANVREVAWFVWGPGRIGRWHLLECEREPRKSRKGAA